MTCRSTTINKTGELEKLARGIARFEEVADVDDCSSESYLAMLDRFAVLATPELIIEMIEEIRELAADFGAARPDKWIARNI